MKKEVWLRSIEKRIIRIARIHILAGLFFILIGFIGYRAGGPAKVLLADNGKAAHSVVVSFGASERTREAAKYLAEYLGRITGGEFIITEGDGTGGIAVGSFMDFPKLGLDNLFDPGDLTRRDEYIMRSHNKGVYLVGALDYGAQHAVWDFLYRIGYRQFFPTDSWEIIPEEPDLSIKLDAFERPDFYNRDGPRIVTWGPSSDDKLWHRWHDRNRITSSIIMETDHEYPNIIARNRQIFDEHPEYLALVGGVRGGGRGDKFCISNSGLRQLVVEDARKRVKNNPESLYFSVDPSDGGDYCECEACAQIGSITDQVITLANEVAEAINNMGYGERFVGNLAYASYSPPPNIDVHTKVIINIATEFLRGGYTVEELIEGWSERTKMTGIREYYSTFVWDQGIPRLGPGGNVNYLIEKIPYYYDKGARFMNANSTDAWVAYGPGYYLSARFLWDVDEVERVDELINDFLDKSFGEAREPMAAFYYMIARDYNNPRTNEDLLAHMYGYIKEARELTNDPKVLNRLDEIALYTRYVELWFSASGNLLRHSNVDSQNARDKAAQDLYRHAYRMQSRMMSPVGQLYLYLRREDVEVNIPDEANPGSLSVGMELEDMEPWKSSRLFTDVEIAQFIEDGVTNYKKDEIEFEIVTFSEVLEPADQALGLRKVSTGDMGGGNSFIGQNKMLTWLRPDEKLILEVSGGHSGYRNRGNIRFMLLSPQEELVEPVDTDETVPPDGEKYKIVLESPFKGLHKLEWMDGGDQSNVIWPEGFPMTVSARMEDPARLGDNFKLYFYVPKGTKTVGGYYSHQDAYRGEYINHRNLQIFDGNANTVLDLSNVKGGEGYFNIPVTNEQDGTLWELQGSNLIVMLMTVPPCLARNEKELLLPKEVIEADMLKR